MTVWTDTASAWTATGASWTGQPVARPHTTTRPTGRGHTGSTIAHPMRCDAAGRVATITAMTARHAAEIVGHVLSCQPGERALAPGYGLESQAAGPLSADLIASVVVACEPDITVTDVHIDLNPDGRARVAVSADWARNRKA